MWGVEASSCCHCFPDYWTDSGDRFDSISGRSAEACLAVHPVAAAVEGDGDEIVGTRPEIAPTPWTATVAGHSAAAGDVVTGTALGVRWTVAVAFAGIP